MVDCSIRMGEILGVEPPRSDDGFAFFHLMSSDGCCVAIPCDWGRVVCALSECYGDEYDLRGDVEGEADLSRLAGVWVFYVVEDDSGLLRGFAEYSVTGEERLVERGLLVSGASDDFGGCG